MTQLNKDQVRGLQGLAGQLNWAPSQTRPVVAYNAYKMNVSIKNGTINNSIQAKRHMLEVKRESLSTKRSSIRSCRTA